MPNDPYQIGEDNSGITLVLADRGVSVAAAHAIEHVTGGNDKIRDATTTQDGLMTTAHALKLDGITAGAQPTNATLIATALNGVTTATPEAGDQITFLDGTDSALKRVTLTNFFDFLDDSFVRITGTQSVTGTKTFTSVVLTTADINGGTINGAAITLSGASPNTFIGALPVANGGTGSTSAATGTGGVVLDSGPTITDASLVTPALGTPGSGLLTNCTGLPIANTTGTLAVAKGGTGVTTLTAGVVRADGTSAFTTGAVSLASEVSGVLPITYGGTSFSQLSYGQMGSQTAAGSAISFTTDFQKVTMATTLGSPSANFISPNGSGTLTYIGTQTRNFLVFASLDMLGDEVGDGYAIKLALDSVVIDATECRAYTAGKTGNFMAKLVTSWIISLNTNQTLELWASSPHSDAGTPQRMRLIATPV